MKRRQISLLSMPVLVVGVLFFLAGCGDSPAANREGSATQAEAGAQTHVVDPAAKTQEQQIAALEAKLAAATEKGDEIARLSALRDLLGAREAQAQAEAKQLHAERDQANADLGAARLAADAVRLYWFAGVLGLAALLGVVVAIWVPQTAKWAVRFSIACGAVAGLAIFVAGILPYLWWIGAGLVAAGIVAALWWWRMDARSKTQIVQAVETFKDKMPGYREHFARVIDNDVDQAIDATREHLHAKAKSAEAVRVRQFAKDIVSNAKQTAAKVASGQA